jgi:hypothetical protein
MAMPKTAMTVIGTKTYSIGLASCVDAAGSVHGYGPNASALAAAAPSVAFRTRSEPLAGRGRAGGCC